MSEKGLFFVWCLIGLTAFLVAACGGGGTPSANPQGNNNQASTPTVGPSPTPPPLLTSDQVFNLVSPSVALISTTTTSGNAILIDGGYLLTNSLFEAQIPEFELLSQENVQTNQGLDAVRIEYLARQRDFHGSRLIIFDDNNLAINFSIHTTSEQYEIMNEMIDYIFDSFRSE